VCSANWDVTLPRLVLNQTSRERVVGSRGGGEITVALSAKSKAAQSDRTQLGARGGPKQRGLKAEEDRDMVRAGRGEGVRPFRKVW